MKIFTFSQIGNRTNNEDNVGWNERLLMVCDGVGGHVSGEVASKFVVDNMLELFKENVPNLNKIVIQEKLNKVQNELNNILDREPQYAKMGSTFTGVFMTDSKWYLAHIGDSRIYLFRPSESKLWFTNDHSLVGELMAHHEITREEGRFHPLSNRISKAIIANFEKTTQSASITAIDEVRAGDVLLLCSDGVVEAWGENELVDLFADDKHSFAEKCEMLKAQCQKLSKDNNTALIAEVENADAFSYGTNEELQWVSFQDVKDDYATYLAKQESKQDDADALILPEEPIVPDAVPKAAMQAVDIGDEVSLMPESKTTQSDTLQPDDNLSDNAQDNSGRNKKYVLIIVILVLIISSLVGTMLLKHGHEAKSDLIEVSDNQNLEITDRPESDISSGSQNGGGELTNDRAQDDRVDNKNGPSSQINSKPANQQDSSYQQINKVDADSLNKRKPKDFFKNSQGKTSQSDTSKH